MECVALRVFPVDVADGEALEVTLNGLGERLAEPEEIVDALVDADWVVGFAVLQCLYGVLNAGLGERVLLSLEANRVQCRELACEDCRQEHAARAPAARGQRLVRWQVTPAEVDEELEGGNLRRLVLSPRGGGEVRGGHEVGMGISPERSLSSTALPLRSRAFFS